MSCNCKTGSYSYLPQPCGSCQSGHALSMPSKTSVEWALENPVLCLGYTAYESDTGKWKIGNGTDKYTDLQYQAEPGVAGPQGPEGPAGPAGPVTAPPPYSLAIGSVTVGPVPLATITGVPGNQVLNLVLPSTGGGGGGSTATVVFVSSPSDLSVYAGDKVSLFANAQSTESPISYKWQQTTDGTTWSDNGVNGQKLEFTSTIADNGKAFRCVATTATAGPAYSLVADLEVKATVPGRTWRPASKAAPKRLQFWDGQFSGIGGSISPDGITWSSTFNFVTCAASNGSSWVALKTAAGGYFAVPFTSPDAINYTQQTAFRQIDNRVGFPFLSYQNGRYFAFVNHPPASLTNNVANTEAWYSSDGDNWARGTVTGLVFSAGWGSVIGVTELSRIACVANSTSLSIAVGVSGELGYEAPTNKYLRSTNQTAWTAGVFPLKMLWRGIGYGNGKFVAVGDGGYSVNSTDGVHWTVSQMPAAINWAGVAYGAGLWVAVGGPSSVAAVSTDGQSWTKVTLPASAVWNDIVYGNGRFLATTTTGISAYSS